MERIYHTWEKWECYPAGFYDSRAPGGMTKEEAEETYRELLADADRFGAVLSKVIVEWKHSCEHYLSNVNMNRIAWLGQAALAYACGIPSCYRGGFNRLTEGEQAAANGVALEYLNRWLEANDAPALDAEGAQSQTVAELY